MCITQKKPYKAQLKALLSCVIFTVGFVLLVKNALSQDTPTPTNTTQENPITHQAASQARITQNLRLKNYTGSGLGLIGEVLAVTQDRQGFMWFGGKNGLARLDGYNSKVFQHNNADLTSISTNTINDLLIDKFGQLWIATYFGLNLYQPHSENFERFNYDAENPRSVSHNSILKLFESREGELWIATDGGGLLRFNRQTRDFDRFNHDPNNPKKISGNSVSAISQDDDGLLWVGIKGNGIDIFNPKTSEVVKHIVHNPDDTSSLSNAHATAITKGADGTMWVGTYWGLNRHLGDYQFEHYFANVEDIHLLNESNINRIITDKEGQVWIATGDQGLARYNSEYNNFDTFLHNQEGRSIYISALFQDNSQGLWLGLTPGGAARIDRYSSAFLVYQNIPGENNSLSNTDVISITEDSNQNLWIGTRDGLNHLNRKTNEITRYQHDTDDPYSLPSRVVSSLILEDENTLWVGTTWSGIGKLNLTTQKFHSYFPEDGNPNSLSNREVWSMLKTEEGEIWAGTNNGGLHKYNKSTDDFHRFHFSQPNKKASGRALSIIQDPLKDIWLGTDDGLFRLPAKHSTFIPGEDDTQVQKTDDFFEYFGTNEESIINLRIPVVRDIFQDSNNNLWLATEGDGVKLWNRQENELEEFRARNGLVNNTVSAITEDNSGDIWLSTAGGISRLTPSTKTFTNFTRDHGLPGDIFSSPAAIKTSQGEIAFGGMDGLIIIDPNNIFTNTFKAPLVMTGFYLFNQPVLVSPPEVNLEAMQEDKTVLEDYEASLKDKEAVISEFTLPQAITHTKKIKLQYNQSVFTFEFALLNYDITEQNQYAYQLQGFDEDWTHSGSRRTASYTNIDPGKYLFRVKAANNEGVWNEEELQITLIISPPWWKTWWAYLTYTLIALGFLASIIHRQYAKRQFFEQQNRILEERIKERTQELEEKNSELLIAYEKMEEASYSDQLTGLKNRRYLYSSIDLDISKILRSYYGSKDPQTVCNSDNNLIFYLIDADHFKSVNDHYGHNNGDIVLKMIAAALSETCRESDMIIRWGGEEFLVVCRYSSRQFAAAMAEKLRATIANIKFELDTQEVINRTCSIGYACYPFDIHNPKLVNMEQTIAIADWCLYRAKHNGRNGWAGVQLTKALPAQTEDVLNQLDNYLANDFLQVKEFKD